jgi:hypothetical protein
MNIESLVHGYVDICWKAYIETTESGRMNIFLFKVPAVPACDDAAYFPVA